MTFSEALEMVKKGERDAGRLADEWLIFENPI